MQTARDDGTNRRMRKKRKEYGGRYMRVREDRPKHDLHVRIAGDVALILEQWSRDAGRTVGQEVERLVREQLDRDSANPSEDVWETPPGFT